MSKLTRSNLNLLAILESGFWTPAFLMFELLNRDVRWWAFWRRWSGPGFYQRMARLEVAGLVEHRDERVRLYGYVIKKRFYRLVTPATEK